MHEESRGGDWVQRLEVEAFGRGGVSLEGVSVL